MNSELSFDYRITDSVSPGAAAIWKAIGVTLLCVAIAIVLLISAKDVYRVLPDPGLLMDPPIIDYSRDQQYATTAATVRPVN